MDLDAGAGPPTKKKRKRPVSTSGLSLKELAKRGWLAQKVEQRIPHSFITRDLFGCIDIIAIDPDGRTIGIQACRGGRVATSDRVAIGGDHAEHVAKILAEPRARRWIEVGNILELWTWRLGGDAGKRKRWSLQIESFTLEMFGAAG